MFKRLYRPVYRLNQLFDGLSDRFREGVFLSVAGGTLLISMLLLYLCNNPWPFIGWAAFLGFFRLPYLSIRMSESKSNKYND